MIRGLSKQSIILPNNLYLLLTSDGSQRDSSEKSVIQTDSNIVISHVLNSKNAHLSSALNVAFSSYVHVHVVVIT